MANEFFKKAIKHNVEVDIKTPGVSMPVKPSTPQQPLPEKPIEKKVEEVESKPFIKAVDKSGMSEGQKVIDQLTSDSAKEENLGIAGSKLMEPLPKFIETPSEVVYSNQNGSFIILGRDRPGNRLSGYGGKGDTKAASIDLVVGYQGSEALKVNENDEQLYVDPDFKKDAARIYISQRSDIDDYFKLTDGRVGNSKTKSAIGIKADGVRIIAREGIKLVTRVDDKNSQGGPVRVVGGIDLIAGNDDSTLQSIPKGDNLKEALQRLTHHLNKLSGIVDAFLHIQMEYNQHIATHWHNSPFFALPTTPSEVLVPEGAKAAMNMLTKVKRSLVAFKTNLAAFQITYLNVHGKRYINSRYNNVN